MRGVPLNVAYGSFDKTLSDADQKANPQGLQSLWNPERARVCVQPPSSSSQQQQQQQSSQDDGGDDDEENPSTPTSPAQKSKCNKTEVFLVWGSIIALIVLIDYYVIQKK